MSIRNRRDSRSNRVSHRRGRISAGESYPRLPWVGYEVDSPVRLMNFMQQIVKDAYTSKLGPRQVGALNGAVRNLMEALGVGDYHMEEMAKRIAALEKGSGTGRSANKSRIQSISSRISEN